MTFVPILFWNPWFPFTALLAAAVSWGYLKTRAPKASTFYAIALVVIAVIYHLDLFQTHAFQERLSDAVLPLELDNNPVGWSLRFYEVVIGMFVLALLLAREWALRVAPTLLILCLSLDTLWVWFWAVALSR